MAKCAKAYVAVTDSTTRPPTTRSPTHGDATVSTGFSLLSRRVRGGSAAGSVGAAGDTTAKALRGAAIPWSECCISSSPAIAAGTRQHPLCKSATCLPLEWNFQKRLELPNAFGTSKDFFMHVRWKSARVEKICEGSNFEIAVTVISRAEIAPLIARFLIWVGEHPLLQSQSCHPRRFFHPRGTSTQVAQKNLWKFQKRLELPNAFGTSTQVAHKLHTQPRPTISRACPCHCPFRGARARAIPRRKSVNHRNTQDKVRRMARKAARVPMANAPLASNLLPVGRAPFRIRPL